MTAKRNGVKYTLVDSENRTGIDWHSENPAVFGNDALECVVIDGKDKDYDFTSEQIGNGTIEGAKSKEVFDKANLWYNKMRGAIREELRGNYLKGFEEVKNNLD